MATRLTIRDANATNGDADHKLTSERGRHQNH